MKPPPARSPSPANHLLTVAYAGTAYRGWQRQGNDPTVQLLLERALATLFAQPVTLHGSGRTDTGVHALAQTASFQAPPRFRADLSELVRALNAHLPPDIRVLRARIVPTSFHARFSATGKEYLYRLHCGEPASPFEFHRAWQLRRTPDLDRLRSAAAPLLGTHDFASFASNPGYARETTVRTLHQIGCAQRGRLITLRFRGDGFLYRMVRNLTGALVRVGDGRLEPADIPRILHARRRSAAPPTAPAHGLYLSRVFYFPMGPPAT